MPLDSACPICGYVYQDFADNFHHTKPDGVHPTKVWFVQGKKENKDFRSALALHRENAILSENKENIPPIDDEQQKDPKPDQ